MTTYYAKSLEDVISSATAPFNPSLDQLWWKLPENMLYMWNGLTWVQSTALAASDPTKANVHSPAFTGVPTVPTAPPLTNSIQIASTAFVRANSLTDAVADGQLYGRKNKTWSPIQDATTALALKVSRAGDIMTGKLVVPASTSGAAPINLPHGVPPTIPSNGDIWTLNTGLYARINGVTVGPFGSDGNVGLGEAPNDGQTYGRKNLGWTALAGGGGAPEAPTDGGLYARINANWDDLNPKFSLKADLVGPVFTGNPTAPTPAPGNNSTSIATTAFVANALGGGAAIYIGDVPPPNPTPGQMWWESDTGNLFIYYNDGVGVPQWVTATAQAGVQGPPGSGGGNDIKATDVPPSNPDPGDLWWESDSGKTYIWYVDANSSQWVQTTSGGGGGSQSIDSAFGFTIDTGEKFRLIMLSTGAVFAIPYAAVPPPAPTGVTIAVRLTSVNISWPIVPQATSFVIKRNGVQIATSVYQSYRDVSVVVGNTYEYTVSSVDQYRQRSPQSAPVTAYINASLNAAPTNVVITCWPTPVPTDGYSLVRVNAREIDVQTIAYALGVDAGSLTSTADPSVWVFRI